MSVTRGYIGLGTTLEYSDDDGTTWTEVARLSEIGEIGFGEVDQVEVTGYDSTNRTREYIAGLADPPELEVTGVFTADESHEAVAGFHESGAVIQWRATLPDDVAQITFDAYVANFSVTPQLEDRIEFMATLQASGRPTLTVPAPGDGDGS